MVRIPGSVSRFRPPPLNASAKNPHPEVDFSNYIPVNAAPYFFHDNKVPYNESYMLSIQRQLFTGTLLTLSYTGNQGHHLMVVQESNPGDPALCLSVSEPSQVAPGSPTCGPFAENGVFTRANGEVINGTRGPLGPNYGTVTAQKAIANSNYNAFEANLRYAGKRSDFLIGYTFSKSIDEGSNLGEQIHPFNIRSEPIPLFVRHEARLCGELYLCASVRSIFPVQPPDRWLEHFRHNPLRDRFSRDDVRQYR